MLSFIIVPPRAKTKRRFLCSRRNAKRRNAPPPPFCDPRNARSGRRRHSRGFLASRERAGLDVPGRAGDAARGISKSFRSSYKALFSVTTDKLGVERHGIHSGIHF